MDSLLISILCIAVIVIGALVALVALLLKPKKNQTQISTGNIIRRPRKDWKSWIPLFIIALVLLFWSGWMALLFLVTAWIMRLDPAPDSNYMLDENQKKTAKRVYAWLFWSPIITVPFFMILLNTTSWNYFLINNSDFTALVPLIFHIPLLAGLTSKNTFVYRHTQQGILLIALRAGMAALTVGVDGLGLFLLGNGALWLFGTMWGRNQVIRGKCWWIQRKGETILPPEMQTVEEPVIIAEPQQPAAPIIKKNKPAVEQSLHTFRTGTPEERKQAVLALSQLGEVETF